MTMHAVVLPGYQQSPTVCLIDGCPANLGIVSRRGHWLREWERSVDCGPTAIDAFLAKHNAAFRSRHKIGCPLADLPPVVHASYPNPADGRPLGDQLREVLQKVADARTRGDRPDC
ncbi:hypothetical protein [Streptomyces cylindrosporus]|uniref:Uncharacterized protein n=1 Tax=Streptomyces cylindrosporus TaxID=2927583 RepID=A0ABS9YFJ5_9ACTN|nr:hypothetical protein [Streptomyces cylindrosporus]MCI3275991.1 hypothetical protein [Streptomyces cylindrosporus]